MTNTKKMTAEEIREVMSDIQNNIDCNQYYSISDLKNLWNDLSNIVSKIDASQGLSEVTDEPRIIVGNWLEKHSDSFDGWLLTGSFESVLDELVRSLLHKDDKPKGLDLKKMEQKLDDALAGETKESLQAFLDEEREDDKPKDFTCFTYVAGGDRCEKLCSSCRSNPVNIPESELKQHKIDKAMEAAYKDGYSDAEKGNKNIYS